ncbi:hypothetical protein H5410_019772 [Solanum commersonii]|uniref:Uncharacterized protein n=1 Tax=Solanum commersonii TaxID=4109 RepID=A0A9J5Z663_SOLCO|nr:hypothetical protein H5410_019772 [Solanum commersonii]
MIYIHASFSGSIFWDWNNFKERGRNVDVDRMGANLDDSQIGRSVLRNYWFLLSLLIFSDCPKKPGEYTS